MSATADTTVLERKLSEFIGVLAGTGAGEGDLQRALTTEAGQCAWQIGQNIGPATKAGGVEKLERELYTQFTTKPAYTNFSEEQQYSSTADFTWLYAGPHFLVGINDEDNQVKASTADAMEMFYAGRKAVPRGNAWRVVGKRGKQSVMVLNRVRLTQARFNAVRKAIADKFGEAKASWAATAAEYLKAKAIPAWVRSKIPAVRGNGKHVLQDDGLRAQNPFLIFGSRAPGVESNRRMAEAIRAGIERSRINLGVKIRKVLAGAKYRFETGQVVPVNFGDQMGSGLN